MPTTAMAMTMIQTRRAPLAPEPPPVEVAWLAKSNCEMATGRATTNSAPLVIQLAIEMSTPELTARVASHPCC
jgi:hypothetical protein